MAQAGGARVCARVKLEFAYGKPPQGKNYTCKQTSKLNQKECRCAVQAGKRFTKQGHDIPPLCRNSVRANLKNMPRHKQDKYCINNGGCKNGLPPHCRK